MGVRDELIGTHSNGPPIRWSFSDVRRFVPLGSARHWIRTAAHGSSNPNSALSVG